MKYPINPDRYITAMQAQLGPHADIVESFRDYYIPAMNEAYQDGKAGAPGYPQSPAAEIAAFEEAKGPLTAFGRQFITAFIGCLNSAYAQGQQKVKEVAYNDDV